MKLSQDPKNLRCNFLSNPQNVDNDELYLSWELPLIKIGTSQQAYRIIAATTKDLLSQDEGDLWDTGKVSNSNSNQILYNGIMPSSGEECFWKVMFWDEAGNPSDWSETARWSRGLGEKGWKAKWIGYDKQCGDPYDSDRPYFCADDFNKGENNLYLPPVPYLRKTFSVDFKIKKAVIHLSALGLVEVELNGKKVNPDHFLPGFSDYTKTVYYRSYDVSLLIENGRNAMGAMLADGWYAGYVGLNPRHVWGDKPRAMIQLELFGDDGQKKTVITDESWSASYGPLLSSDIMHGETYDARLELTGWSTVDYDEKQWDNVETETEIGLIPTPYPGLPVVELLKLSPKEIGKRPDGSIIVDFGQCIAGVVKVRLRGCKGTQITINHAEVLDGNGELYLYANRSARAQDCYILKGNEEETFQPRFTYHGFQYVQISGLQTDSEIIELSAIALGNEQTGVTTLKTSSELVNDIYKMIELTKNSNMFEVPTDVCARDERLGWGAEGHFFMRTASYMSDCAPFMRKWLRDIMDGQLESGCIWPCAPAVKMTDISPFVGDIQSDMGLYIVWTLYKMYGDIGTVRKHFKNLERYFKYLEENNDRYARVSIVGDWLSIIDHSHTDYFHGHGECPPAVMGTAFFAGSALMMAELSEALGEFKKAEHYNHVYEKIKEVFQKKFIQRDNTMRSGTQGAYFIALWFGLLTPEMEKKAVEFLVDDILVEDRCEITCGAESMPIALKVLKKVGRQDIGTKFITSKTFPSIGYMREKGATTLWERWDSILEDGSFFPHPMNAFNHIVFSTVGDWMISGLAGIDAIEPGFKRILINPGVTEDISSVETVFHSIYGQIELKWSCIDGVFELQCAIPANTTAKILLPSETGAKVEEIYGEVGILSRKLSGNVIEMDVTSGKYHFKSQWNLEGKVSEHEMIVI